MKIVFFAQRFYPYIGGVEKHIYEVAFQLASYENEVIVIVPKQNIKDLDNEFIDKNIRIYRFIEEKGKWKSRISCLKFFFNHSDVFKNIDIIQFHDWVAFFKWGMIFYPLSKIKKFHMYITFHGWEGAFPPNRIVIYKRKIAEKLLDGNMCIGKYIEKWYKTKATLISYGGVNKPKDIVENRVEINNQAVFIGRLEKDTGILEYIRSWKIINEINPQLRLIVCGDGSLKEELVELILNEKISNIEFKGFVKDPENFAKNAEFIFTSGYLGILEAFSYKKPVISFYSNELKRDYLQMMPCSAFMWIEKDEKGIVDSIQEIMEKDIDEKLIKAYQFALNNSWRDVCNSYYKLWGTGE